MRTPFHTFDERIYEQNLKLLRNIADITGSKFLLTLKGYVPHHSVELTQQYADGISTSSVYELRAALEYFPELEKHFYSPAVSPADMQEVIDLGVDSVIFNSLQQIQIHNKRLPAWVNRDLRINVQYNNAGSVVFDGYNPNVNGSRLGMTKKAIEHVNLDFEHYNIDGIHIHALSRQDATDLSGVVAQVEQQFPDLLHKVSRINLGGGHAMTRKGYDLDLFKKVIRHLRTTYGCEVYFEPSEYVFHNVGVIESEVISLLFNEKNIAILNTSAKNHMPDILESPHYSVSIEGGDDYGTLNNSYVLAGPTCLSMDVIGEYSFEHELEVGSRIKILDQVPYTMTQSHWFNGIRKPGLKVIDLNGDVKMTIEDSFEVYCSSMRF